MSIIESMRQELEHESQATRRMLERIPPERFGWEPHPKSMSLGRLAGHVAEIPQWAAPILTTKEFNLDLSSYKPFIPTSTGELLAAFDSNLAEALAVMQGQPDATLMELWKMLVNGTPALELPRVAVMRSMVFNHAYHHRGQLSVYLRLNDVPVPAVYGPSADERA